MFPFALFDPQSMFIAGVALILGMMLLRKFWEMRKSLQKPKIREYPRNLYATKTSDPGLPISGTSGFGLQASENGVRSEVNQSDFQKTRNTPGEEPTPSLRSKYEQFDVELLTLSRQIKAEIDTKIVALQLMIADADQVLQRLEGHLPHTHQIAISTPHPAEPDRMRILKAEETAPVPNISQEATPHSTLQTPNSAPHGTGDLKNLVVEDPFAVNDFSFDKAMRDLDQLSSGIPAFDAMKSLDSWDTPKSESPASLPEWDTPLSYPISGFRTAQDRPTSQVHDTQAHHATPGVTSRTSRRKQTYTNKLLAQAPPQLDALMTGEPVGKMGSKPRRAAGQASSVEEDLPAPPVIPKMPPPNAKALLVETAPFSPADLGGDIISVRKAKRHQLQYLIEKGMSPREIAAHLEMPVGEVELIFSLHKRSGLQASDFRLQEEASNISPEAQSPQPEVQSPRVIAAEHVLMPEKVPSKATQSKRRFRVIKNDDGEQVAG